MRDRGGADAAFRAKHSHEPAQRITLAAVEHGRERADQVHRRERRDQIFAHAASHQFAVEEHIVGMSDDEDTGACVAVLSQFVEPLEEPVAIAACLDHDDVRCRRSAIGLEASGDAAFLDAKRRLGHPPILTRRLDQLLDLMRLAKGLDGHARQGGDVIESPTGFDCFHGHAHCGSIWRRELPLGSMRLVSVLRSRSMPMRRLSTSMAPSWRGLKRSRGSATCAARFF